MSWIPEGGSWITQESWLASHIAGSLSCLPSQKPLPTKGAPGE